MSREILFDSLWYEQVAEYQGQAVFKALLRIGWSVKAEKGSSHIQLVHATLPEYTWSFRDSEEIGPVMLSKIA